MILDGLAAAAQTWRVRRERATAAFAVADYAPADLRALRFVALRFAPVFRPLVLRAAPRADAALRVVFFFALFLFFDVIGMSNDSFCV
jgi:hypothetical protein